MSSVDLLATLAIHPARRGDEPRHGADDAASADPMALTLTRLSEQCLAWRDGSPSAHGPRGLRHHADVLLGRVGPTPEAAGRNRRAWSPETIRPHLERATGALPPLPEAWLDLAAVAPKRMELAWHVTAAAARAALQRAGVRQPAACPEAFVRFIDVTGADAPTAGCSHFDIPVAFAPGSGTHGQNVWSAGRAYVAELWLRSGANGTAAPAARSNRIELPRDVAGAADLQADRRDERWLAPSARPAAAEVDILAELAREEAGAAAEDTERDAETEAAVRALYRGLLHVGPRALRQAPALPYHTPEECRQANARRRRLRSARPRRRADGGGAQAAARAGLCWIGRLDRVAPVASAAPRPAEPLPWLPVRHHSAAEAVASGRTPEAEVRPAGEAASATPETEATDTLAALTAELGLAVSLTLRGRVRPGRRVRVAGRPVATRDDGTFAVEYPWTAGLRLPVEVVAAGQTNAAPLAAGVVAV